LVVEWRWFTTKKKRRCKELEKAGVTATIKKLAIDDEQDKDEF
jgi:hypothetical protein